MAHQPLLELAGLAAKIVPPFQGFCPTVHQHPGRYPGLKNAAPMGLKILPRKLSSARSHAMSGCSGRCLVAIVGARAIWPDNQPAIFVPDFGGHEKPKSFAKF
jgi:hypothetical protein